MEDTISPPDSCPTSVDRLLDAAERLVVSRGAANLTLDAVAHEAGVSKGGLLYHFPSKTALLAGMVRRHITDLQSRANRYANGETGTAPAAVRNVAGRLRALVEMSAEKRAIGAAMLAAAAGDPHLLAPCRESYRAAVDEMIKCPGSFERAAVLHLAVDGLLMTDLLNLSPFTADERQRVVECILTEVSEWSSQR